VSGVSVIAQQSVESRVAAGVGVDQGLGVKADQVVQPVAAGSGREQQVVVDQFLEQRGGGARVGVEQSRCGIGIRIRAGRQRQAPKQQSELFAYAGV